MGIYDSFTNRKLPTPLIESYSILRDFGFGGYKAKLQWKYDRSLNDKIVNFKVWRATSNKVQLKKEYKISQKTLEKTSEIKNVQTNGLYNKIYFAQNSKLKFFKSDSSRYDKIEEKDENVGYKFVNIGRVQKNSKGEYSFVDRAVRFGETYLYIISVFGNNLFESGRSSPVTISVEDIKHPKNVNLVTFSQLKNSIMINIKSDTELKEDLQEYIVYRKAETKKDFVEIGTVDVDKNGAGLFIDFDLLPGQSYSYKIYAKDYYDNISFFSEIQKTYYDFFTFKKDVPFPVFNLYVNSSLFIEGFRNHQEVFGYKIERRDVWKYDTNFEIKTIKNIPWKNANNFDQDGRFVFEDFGAKDGRLYQYRITSILKNGTDGTLWVTPIFEKKQDTYYTTFGTSDPSEEIVKLENFAVSVNDSKQRPVFIKFDWQIAGKWRYLTIFALEDGADKKEIIKINVDNIHPNHIYYTGLKEGGSYSAAVKVFDEFDNVLAESTEINTVRFRV